MSYWTNKKIVVTGGSSGLGRAIVEACLAQGADVLAVGRDHDRLESLAVACDSQFGKTPVIRAADVTQKSDVQALFEFADEKFGGRLDALVNNVGQSSRGRITETTDEDFQRLWEVNFLTMVRCTNRALPRLLECKGHVINIGSLASKSTAPFLGPYAASKFAVAAYSQQLRLELSPLGVHVLLVCPGPLRRDDAGSRYDEQASSLPESARRPGGGVKVKGISPARLARSILNSCLCRKPELVVPARARILFALAQLSPTLGDWLIRKMTS